MTKAYRNATHLPILIKLMGMTTGPVLELGAGFGSTPFLHWACYSTNRPLLTLDRDYVWWLRFKEYNTSTHKVQLVTDWDDAPIDRAWDVVLVDHSPARRRATDVHRLRNLAQFIIIHDSEEDQASLYGYDLIWPEFKYRYNFVGVKPNTTVLSNYKEFTL